MTFDIIVSGYPSIDHIMPVSYAPNPGETGIILETPDLNQPNLGGCVLNIAVAVAKLGLKSSVITVIGDDVNGKDMIKTLTKMGVDTEFGAQIVPGGRTAHTFLFVDPENRHQTFYFPGVSDNEDVEIRLADQSEVDRQWGVITVGNAKHNRTALDWMVANGLSILWSHKNDAKAFPSDLVSYLAKVSEVVILNHHEAEIVKQILGLDRIYSLLEHGPRAIILTSGARGSKIITNDGAIEIPSVTPEKMIDSTGAGDAFAAGVLFGLRHELPLNICCQLGAVVASFAVEAWGCQTNLPELLEVKARYNQNFGDLEL